MRCCMVLRRFARMVRCMCHVSMRDVRMMSGFLVIATFVVRGCFLVMTSGMLVMLCGLLVVVCALMSCHMPTPEIWNLRDVR